MRKNKILALSLVLVLMFSTVVGCGKSEVTSDNNSTTNAADVETTKEETTEAVESTAAEATTSRIREVVFQHDSKLNYSLYSISDETKAMLVKKLTNLVLVKDQEFDMNSLPFKDDEQEVKKAMKAILSKAIDSPKSDNNILKCGYTKVELYEIQSNDSGLKFYFRCSYKTLN